MTLARVACAAILVCMIAASAFAEPAALRIVSVGPDAPAGAQRYVLHSERLGRDFVVVVSTPSGPFVEPGRKIAAVYALDGGYGVAGPIGQLMAWSGTMSPAYVVSVGYPDGQASRRDSDLLFRPTVRDGVTIGGGGAAFEAFLTIELRPFLEARYPLDPTRAILFGHSYGGLFAANVLARTPHAFAGYIIASPSVAADPQALAGLAQAAPRARASASTWRSASARTPAWSRAQNASPRSWPRPVRPSRWKAASSPARATSATTRCWSRPPSPGSCRRRPRRLIHTWPSSFHQGRLNA